MRMARVAHRPFSPFLLFDFEYDADLPGMNPQRMEP